MHLLIVMLFIKQKQKKKLKFIQCLPPIYLKAIENQLIEYLILS